VNERYSNNYEVIIRIDLLVWVLLSPDRHCGRRNSWVLFKEIQIDLKNEPRKAEVYVLCSCLTLSFFAMFYRSLERSTVMVK